jgi:hypothetical protein
LRWAINEANSQSGGIYDSIIFSVDGTIILASALPQITESITITGNGKTNTIIDGSDSYRLFRVASGKTLTISDMTLKQGQATDGGLIYNTQGTVIAENIRFTDMIGGSAVFNANGGSTATYTNCTFDYLSVGISADWGSTPQLASGITTWAEESDSVFSNKTYIDNCIFDNNNMGIASERFTKIENSTFTNNQYAAAVNGLNRTQILNSTFEDNQIGIYHSSWIPTSFNMGTDNRLIDGNIFITNGISIYLDDGYNDGHKYPGWSTVTNNTWDGEGVWLRYYLWVESDNQGFTLDTEDETELFVHSANAISTPPTTTTTTTTTSVPETTTSTTEAPAPQTTTTTEPEAVYVPAPVETTTTLPEESTTTTEVTLPEETTTEETVPTTQETIPTTEPEIIPSEDSIPETDETTPSEPEIQDEEDIQTEVTPEDITTIIEDITSGEITEEILNILESESLTEEQIAEIVDAVVEAIVPGEVTEEVLNILESDALTKEQVAEIVDAILEGDIDEEAAAVLATSAAVLESITSDQASEIFSAIDTGSITEEVKAEIIDAVQDAPAEVKEAFEEEINIYAEGFDDYVPLGSNIDVGTRRSIIAVTAATAAVTAVGATSATGRNAPSGGSGSSNNTKTGNETSARKEEEEEASGEIAGPEDDDDEKFTRNSIFTYYINGGIEMKKFNPFGFLNKVWDITAGLAFTLAGSVVVFITLSGDTRKMAMIATAAALVVHYIHEILDNDE